MKRVIRNAVAGVATLGLLVAGGASAMAAPTIPSADAEASLTLEKFEQPIIAGEQTNGLEITNLPTNLVPIEDVEFTIKKVEGIDLTTNAGWETYQALLDSWDADNPNDVGSLTLGTGVTGTTDANGKIVWNTTPGANQYQLDGIGVYLVEETGYTGDLNIVKKAKPFLVNIPVTSADGQGWVYDVFVYPKNTVADVSKTVEDSGDVYQLGDTVTWTVEGTIPADGTDAYRVVDQFDKRLDVERDDVKVLVKGNGDDIPLVKDVDYTVTWTDASGDNGEKAVVDLTSDGITKAVNALNADDTSRLNFVFPTTVNTVGEIENEATIFFNQSNIDDDEGVTTDKPETKWGGATIHKVDASDTDVDLAGAKFEIWAGKTAMTGSEVPADAVKVTGLAGMDANGVLTTDSDGLAVVDGLRYSDFADDEGCAEGETCFNYYFLKEVEAPSGYNLLAQPVQFIVDGQSSVIEIEVLNKAITDTPQSGGQGIWLGVIIGLTAMGAGGAVYYANKRKEKADTIA